MPARLAISAWLAPGASYEPAPPALAIIESRGIAVGIRALDALVKSAPVRVLAAGPVSGGHYLMVFAGEVEEVRSAYRRAQETLVDAALDAALIVAPQAELLPSLRGPLPALAEGQAVGIIESDRPPTLLAAMDRALKHGPVQAIQTHLALGIGGRAYALICGDRSAVAAALGAAAAARKIETSIETIIETIIIDQADPAIFPALT